MQGAAASSSGLPGWHYYDHRQQQPFGSLATRAGLFGMAVVITSLYPGITVLLARVVLGERMRGIQRAGLVLAAAGIALVTF
jgi:drug/metabolite transporter (DMT)-like permease